MPTEMTDRDRFAAAALTGLIASREWPIDSDEAAHYCYRVADAMLRERERTNHDAAPAARARTDADRGRTDKADCRPGEGTGDTQEPVAWGVQDDRGLQYALHPTPGHASHMARTASVGLGEVVPLYRHRQPALTDAEREAVERSAAAWEAANETRAAWFSADHKARYSAEADRMGALAATLRGLLERMR